MFKNKKVAATVISVMFVLITAVMAFVGIMYKNGWDISQIQIKLPTFIQTGTTPSEDTSSEDTSSQEPTYILPEIQEITVGKFNSPQEMRAVFLTPGEDFYKTQDDTVATVQEDIETAVEKGRKGGRRESDHVYLPGVRPLHDL